MLNYKTLVYLFFAIIASSLTSCLDVNDVDYTDWKRDNDAFYLKCIDSLENGEKAFELISPAWAPQATILMKWHNDRELTKNNLIPLSNSTVNVKYILENYEGDIIQDSFSSTTYGDSIYRCQPCQNIVGFWAGLTMMHVGDSVTMIIPSNSGYGNASAGSVKPFSTLIYHVKLKSIQGYEIP